MTAKTKKISNRKFISKIARKDNIELINLLKLLKKQKEPIYSAILAYLIRPRRKAIVVNLYKINKLTNPGEIAIIPGKVLATGTLDHDLVVVAKTFSEKAKQKLSSKANFLTIQEFILKKKDFKGIPMKIII